MSRMDHHEQQHAGPWPTRGAESTRKFAQRSRIAIGRPNRSRARDHRRLLRRFNTTAEIPLFREHGPLTDRDGRLSIDSGGRASWADRRPVRKSERRSSAASCRRRRWSSSWNGWRTAPSSGRIRCWRRHVRWSAHPARFEQWSFTLDSMHCHDRCGRRVVIAGIAMAMMDAVPTVESIDRWDVVAVGAMLHLGILQCWQA